MRSFKLETPALQADREFNLGARLVFFPDLCTLPNGRLLIASHAGRVFELAPEPGEVTCEFETVGPLLNVFCTPTASGGDPAFCSAATRTGHVIVWQLGTGASRLVYTEGPANAVALSHAGDLLAVGCGYYPLRSSHNAQAIVQVFSLADEAEEIGRRVLPGVAVDQLRLNSEIRILAAVTGALNQRRGHIALLDSFTLQIVDLAEADVCDSRAVFFDEDSEYLIVVYRSEIQVRPLGELSRIEWRWQFSEPVLSAAYDPSRELVYLSNGDVVNPRAHAVGRFEPLPDCTGLTLLDDRRLAGVSNAGVLRIWNVREAPRDR